MSAESTRETLMNLTNIERGALVLFAVSVLTAGCAAESNDPGPPSSTGPIVADGAPAPPAVTNASNATPAPAVGAKTSDSAPPSASAGAENVVPAPNPTPVPSTKTNPCQLACALCELPGHADDCAKCHSEECR
jgi:hypothetical protein